MAAGMLLAVVITLIEVGRVDYRWIAAGWSVGSVIGVAIVLRAQATQMPQIVARFNGFGGASSALVALSLFWLEVVETAGEGPPATVGGDRGRHARAVGGDRARDAVTGSVLAELKLRGTVSGTPVSRCAVRDGGLLVLGGLVRSAWSARSRSTDPPRSLVRHRGWSRAWWPASCSCCPSAARTCRS
jgi:NAD/NADP transhydrogenase beta subunit